MSPNKIKGFKELQEIWYAKLATVGFVDIEKDGQLLTSASYPYRHIGSKTQKASYPYRHVGSEDAKSITSNYFQRLDAFYRVLGAKQLYFEMISSRVQVEKFDCDADEIIMRRTAEGAQIKAISEELKVLGHKNERKTIRYVIRKYEHRWNIKTWKPEQLTWRRS